VGWTLWLKHGDKQKIPALAGNGILDRGHPHYRLIHPPRISFVVMHFTQTLLKKKKTSCTPHHHLSTSCKCSCVHVMLIPIVYYQCVCMFNEFVCACTCFLLSCLPKRKQTLVDAETRSAVRLQKSQYCKQTWLLSSYRMKYLLRRWHINIPLTRIQAVRRLNLLQFNLTNFYPATAHTQTVLR
jgi:hypothetical protein